MQKSSLYFVLAILMALSLPSPSDAEYLIDLYPPYQGLMIRLENISSINIAKLLAGAQKLIGCLTPDPVDPATLFAESEFSSLNIQELKLNFSQNITDELKDYVKSPEFEQIHTYLWADNHWNDFIRFLHKSGFNSVADPDDPDRNIYTKIRKIYDFLEVPSHLTLPSGPSASPLKTSGRKTMSKPTFSNFNLWSLISMFQGQSKCTEDEWMEGFKDIVESQGIQWLELVRFLIGQVNSNPSVHVAWAKITEPAKGDAFRFFRVKKEAMVKLIHHWDTQLKNNQLFQLIISILEGITGINFNELNINVVGNIISIVEWLVWGMPFPRPELV